MDYKYYYHEGMLYRTLGEKVWAMIEGKDWMEGWNPGDSINEKNLITDKEAREITEHWGETF